MAIRSVQHTSNTISKPGSRMQIAGYRQDASHAHTHTYTYLDFKQIAGDGDVRDDEEGRPLSYLCLRLRLGCYQRYQGDLGSDGSRIQP